MSPNVLAVPGETNPDIWTSGVPQPTAGRDRQSGNLQLRHHISRIGKLAGLHVIELVVAYA